MAHEPLTVPPVPPARPMLLPVSFAGCGALLALLLVVLIGCASFGSTPGEVANPDKNAVVCECECDPPGGAIPVPFAHFIEAGGDDAEQGRSNGNQLSLGQNTVGLRFLNLGVPRFAEIDDARIQFAAAQASGTSFATLQIRILNSANAAAFGDTPDFDVLGPLLAESVTWSVPQWVKVGDAGPNESTPNLKTLLQAIVSNPQYTPESAVAFIIQGQAGTRVAAAFEATSNPPATLTVQYKPPKAGPQDFMTCVDPNDAKDPVKADAFCRGAVQNGVHKIATACSLANACTCKLKPGSTTAFSNACKSPCPPLAAPNNCDPNEIAKATLPPNPTATDTPVCVANSPLGSLMTGRLSACDLDEPNTNVLVRVFDEDGENPHSASNTARGRIQFVGTPCPGAECEVGLIHGINVNDLQFSDALSDHKLTDITAVGENVLGVFAGLNTSGAGAFAIDATNHSVRGTDINEDDGGTKGFYRGNASPLNVSVGGWQSGGACSMEGTLIDQKQVKLFANLKGKLVNQPPNADAGDDQLNVQCSQLGGATVNLDASRSSDPDGNIVSFAWFKGSRNGPLVGNVPRGSLFQPVSTPAKNNKTEYVFKIFDSFGQYDDDTTTVNVVDTVKPVVTAPPAITAECTGPSGQAVVLDPDSKASADDVCDGSIKPSPDGPQLFTLGTTTVKWSATDLSGNTGTASQAVTVQDTKPPTLTVKLSPTSLWPPNHKMVPITATITVSDVCDPNPKVKLVSITSNEADNGLGDGDTSVDIQEASVGSDDRTFLLRAERSGRGTGRVYTVTYEARDASDNATTVTATVTVDH